MARIVGTLALLLISTLGCADPGPDISLAAVVVAEPIPEPAVTTVVARLPIQEESPVKIEHGEFGKTPDGETIEEYTLTNPNGVKVVLISWGATVKELHTPDASGKSGNIVLGHTSLENWLENPCYFNCTVGRYGNRIRQGAFELGGNVYSLATNNAPNHLHGGETGFHKRVWSAESKSDKDSASVMFTRTSKDGEDGYPGNLDVIVTYTLTTDNELKIDYEAVTDKATVINLTNHCYWNLSGDAKNKSVLDHLLTLNCNLYLPVDDTLIPTGDMLAVAETPMNFVIPHTIGNRIDKVEGGYDHCYVINRDAEGLVPAATVVDQNNGRTMEIFTTEPGIQFYSGNFLSGEDENGGFKKHHGFCLETQHYPDSPNQPSFPSTVLKPGETYKTTTIHKFGVVKPPTEDDEKAKEKADK